MCCLATEPGKGRRNFAVAIFNLPQKLSAGAGAAISGFHCTAAAACGAADAAAGGTARARRRGPGGPAHSVRLRRGRGGSRCGWVRPLGCRYVVRTLLYRLSQGTLVVNLCICLCISSIVQSLASQ